MPQPDKNLFRLEHILEAIEKIDFITNGLNQKKFLSDWILQDAVVRNLEIIGEAVNAIDEDLKKSYPSVPWAKAKGIRNIIIHEYFRVDAKEVWTTAKESLPEFKAQILTIRNNLKSF